MARMIRPPDGKDVTRFLRMLFLRTEMALIQEILRKRSSGLVEYAEVAAMERVQAILRNMVDESWEYVPTMVEKIFYQTGAAASGYHNARVLTAPQTAIAQQLSDNLLGELTEAAEMARESVQECFTIARLEKDPLREAALKQVLRKEAAGSPWIKGSEQMMRELQNKGVTVFIDKAGRRWSLQDYCNMAARTTARQAQVAALLTADDHDLWQIVKVGSTCKVCAALEGRVYSKSGTNPDYPPLTLAFGKVDPSGADDLNNTYLNIHPNCLHSLVKYTTIGKTEKQVQKDKDFSDPEKNPVNRDPRTKKQIAAYREKERKRRRLLADMRQHQEYRSLLGNEIPKDFAKFKELKYNNPEKWSYIKGLGKYLDKYPTSDKRYYNVDLELKKLGIKVGVPLPPVLKQAFILPEGRHDPYHIMKRMLERGMTDDDIHSYMRDANCMFVQWNGTRQRFVSKNGMVVITKSGNDWLYKTAWKKEDYDVEADKIMEVLKKYGIEP